METFPTSDPIAVSAATLAVRAGQEPVGAALP
jgi:hypothetical protein